MVKNASIRVECPKCSEKAINTETIKKIPHFGECLLSSIFCPFCGFHSSNVLSLESKEPKAFKAKILTLKDLSIKVIKSSSTLIEFPELGIKIQPTASSEGFISNVEGVLKRVESAVSVLEESTQKQKILKKIKQAMNAEIPFTIILKDRFGNGALIGKKVKKIKF
jgi:zinc finger protein